MSDLKVEFIFPSEPFGDLETYWEALPAECELSVSYSQTDGVWLAGNGSGLLLLAKLLAEMAVRDLGSGWHRHLMRLEEGSGEFTIEKIPDAVLE